MKRTTIVLGNLLFFIFMLTSCEQRDPQAEYELLCETIYLSPREGIEAAQEYLDYFHNNKKARRAEVFELKRQYQQIDIFLSNTFNSYADFLNQTRKLNKELSHSDYLGIRKMWSSNYKERHDRLLGELIDSITESDFDDFFKREAWQISDREFLSSIESVDRISISVPTLVNDGTAKKAKGEYRVHLKLGLKNMVAEISIEGTGGIDASGNLIFVRTGYQVTKSPSLFD